MKVVTYNLDHYNPLGFGERSYQYPDTGINNRFALIEEVIRSLDPDILLVQEIFGRTYEEIEYNVRHLAQETGLVCHFGRYLTAVKSNHHYLATAILWNPRVEPYDWRPIEGFWHPLSMLSVEINGVALHHLCYHGQPLGRCMQAGDIRAIEASYLVEIVRPYSYLLIGGDWNSLGAAQFNNNPYYDPHLDAATLLAADLTPEEMDFATSRVPAEVLTGVGLVDVTATLPGPRICTKGHRPARLGKQRLDRFYATKALFAAVCSTETVLNEFTVQASDHLPVVVVYASH